MNRKRWLVFLILPFLLPSSGFATDDETYLPKWIEVLKTGSEREKKIALENLWFLKEPKYRKDGRVFDPLLKLL